MLKIRPEQFAVFQPVAERAFVRRLVEHLRDHHPEVVVRFASEVWLVKQLGDAKIYALVGNAIARARALGLDWESSITAFVALMFVVAPNFDEHPLIQRVLKDERVPANSRLEQLWERTTEENWEAARKNYDVNAWHPQTEEKSHD
jgi:hypothetical protein